MFVFIIRRKLKAIHHRALLSASSAGQDSNCKSCVQGASLLLVSSAVELKMEICAICRIWHQQEFNLL